MRSVLVWMLTAMVSSGGVMLAQEEPQAPKQYVVRSGTRIPLVLVYSVSTRWSRVGGRVYLKASKPIYVDGRMAVPWGSEVVGTITHVKRPEGTQERGEVSVRFDTLRLPNGVTRDFRGPLSAMDGDRQGTVKGAPSKGEDAGAIAETSASSATIGAGAGPAPGLGAVLVPPGSEFRLLRGTALEMQLDRDLTFTADEIRFVGTPYSVGIPSPPSRRPGGEARDSIHLRLPQPPTRGRSRRR